MLQSEINTQNIWCIGEVINYYLDSLNESQKKKKKNLDSLNVYAQDFFFFWNLHAQDF